VTAWLCTCFICISAVSWLHFGAVMCTVNWLTVIVCIFVCGFQCMNIAYHCNFILVIVFVYAVNKKIDRFPTSPEKCWNSSVDFLDREKFLDGTLVLKTHKNVVFEKQSRWAWRFNMSVSWAHDVCTRSLVFDTVQCSQWIILTVNSFKVGCKQ